MFGETKNHPANSNRKFLQAYRHGYDTHNHLIFVIVHYATLKSRCLVYVSFME